MEESWSAEQTRLLADLGAWFTSFNQIEVLPKIAQRLVPLLGDWCAVIIRDEHQQMRRVAIACADPSEQSLIEQLASDSLLVDPHSAPALALQSGSRLLLTDLPDSYSEDPAFSPAYQAILRQIRPRHILCVPMRLSDRVCGVLAFTLLAKSGRQFTQADIALAEEVAQRMALLVDNVLLYRTMQRRLDQLLLVQQVAALVNSTLQTETLCQLVVDQLRRAFGYQLVSIYLLQEGVLRLQAVVGYDRVLSVIRLHEGVAGRVMRSGKAEFVRDARYDPDFLEVMPGTTQCIIMPLRYDDGQPVGVIIVESLGNPALDDEDLFLLSLLADQISVALHNTTLFTRMVDSFERFRSLIELAGNIIICLDRELRITEFNRMAEQVFSHTHAEVIGKPYLTTLLSEAERPLFMALAREVMTSDHAHSFETTLTLRDRKHHLFWTISCRRHLNGEIAEFLLIGQDLTEQREKTAELLRYERRVQQLERLERLGVMAGSVAHDFNNLLNIIVGNAQLIERVAPLSPVAQYHHTRLMNAVQQAADLVQRLFNLAGREQVDMQPLDLNRLVIETLSAFRASMSEQVRIHLDLDSDIPPVIADPVQMRQVVLNLVNNAGEALIDGSGDIWIQTRQRRLDVATMDRLTPHRLVPGNYVTLEVRDNGSGIDPAVCQHIFEPFFTTKAHGHGLGLAGVLKIVQRHGGALEVDSQPGKGSMFTVWLPPQPPVAESWAALNDTENATAYVLVVDDNDEVRSLIERILTHAGYHARVVASGTEALRLVEQAEPIACALIDISLADISGYEVCRQIAEIDPHLPLALLSGYPIDVDSLGETPVAATLQKPFRAHELLILVQRLLHLRASSPS
ncbi:GAF domain-containing protein [Chloroflexus sp.]|uniref:GAF domain-containing protein n=1 Tax=Chloroflexus sp. TaxID=1904827 RepID=UPI0026020CE7|nr:GAF domain-containing protein [uncultured Chloroflexus sp.]